ncbi:hypothetical protein COOONC_17590 [Cooperia oncophora]
MYSIPHLVFITVLIVIANSVGLFGNLNVIIATIRDTSLRTKAGSSAWCPNSEIFAFTGSRNNHFFSRMAVDQAVCFRMIAVYLFSFIAQSVMYFMLSLDMLIAVVAPLKHKMWPTKPYIILMCLPPAIVATLTFAASYFRGSNPKVTCRPPTAVVHHVVVAYTVIVMAINTAAIAMILSLAYFVNKKGKEMRSSRHQGSRNEDSDSISVSNRNRMIRVLTIVVGVFVCTSYLCVVSVHIAVQMELEEDYHDYIMTFNMVLALLTYIQNYYVLWFRSPRYRRAFFQQLNWLRRCFCFHLGEPTTSSNPTNSRTANAAKNSTTTC